MRTQQKSLASNYPEHLEQVLRYHLCKSFSTEFVIFLVQGSEGSNVDSRGDVTLVLPERCARSRRIRVEAMGYCFLEGQSQPTQMLCVPFLRLGDENLELRHEN